VISVIVPTNRVGGLDLLTASLDEQTFRDFELILVDALYDYRKDLIDAHSVALGFPVWHMPPRDNAFPSQQYCRTMNTGVAHASGDTLLYLCDFSWLHPDCLAAHARLQTERPGPVTLDYRYVDLPGLKPGLPNYREKAKGTEENAAAYTDEVYANSERYAADVKSGRLDEFMWSLFAAPMTEADVNARPVEHTHRPSGADLATDWNWCSFKNESFPTELVLDMNGHDEAYDLSHGWQDSEFSYRLRALGIQWRGGKQDEGLVSIVNPRPIMNIKRMSEKLFYNRDLCFGSRQAELRMPVNPERPLREWRRGEMEP
jgi:glycosyltransferase involved in cell wall biosynthesis